MKFIDLISTYCTASMLVDRLELRDRVSRCERDIVEIKTRIG
jgi:hypothetical protein